jgi:membrane-associated phospholipid phosphatase
MIATSNKAKLILVYLGIILAFISYEIFNKISPTYPPLIMRGWLDEKIPIIPIFVFPYLSFHILAAFIVPYISYRVAGIKAFLVNGISIIVGQLILDIAYAFFQTEVPRPVLSDSSNLNWILVHVIWGNDRPLNGFPSNHVTWSVISIIAIWRLREKMKWWSYILIVWFILIIPATVFLAQHFLIDIYGGILVAFTVYWACAFIIEKPDLNIYRS